MGDGVEEETSISMTFSSNLRCELGPLQASVCCDLPVSESTHALCQIAPRLELGVDDGSDLDLGQRMAQEGAEMVGEASKGVVSSLTGLAGATAGGGGGRGLAHLEAVDEAQQERLLHRGGRPLMTLCCAVSLCCALWVEGETISRTSGGEVDKAEKLGGGSGPGTRERRILCQAGGARP